MISDSLAVQVHSEKARYPPLKEGPFNLVAGK